MTENKYCPAYSHCPVCDSVQIGKVLSDYRGNTIFRCQACLVEFMNPVYSDDYLREYYASYTLPTYAEEVIKEQEYTLNDNLLIIETLAGRRGKLLDFGCGNGQHTLAARLRGWQVVGYDVDCDTTQQVAQAHALDVKCGDFARIDWQGTTFDLIYANQVIEHLKEPVAMLKQFRTLLNDDGLLFVAVPNIRAWSARQKYFLERLGLRRRNIGKYYDSEHHVFYYGKRSLCNMLKLAGFDCVYVRNSRKPKLGENWLFKLIRRNIFERFIPNSAFLVVARKLK